MICFDTNLLADYLDGTDAAAEFLAAHETESWAVPSLALFETYMGAIVGRPRGSIRDVHEATRGLDVLAVTDDVALRAAELQEELTSEGVRLSHVDAVLAGTAATHGTVFATNDGAFFEDAVRDRIDVVEYRR